jgi:hypothetical protein
MFHQHMLIEIPDYTNIWNINLKKIVEHTCIKKATDILAVQMLKFIGSFYWLYKALNTHYEYKSTVHVHVEIT